jgi:hypothetical protein
LFEIFGNRHGISNILLIREEGGNMQHADAKPDNSQATECRVSKWRFRTALLLLLATIGATCAADRQMFAKGKPDSWKEIEGAMLKVNNLPVKDWNVYQVRKKSDPLLFQMGNRFLLIDIHDKQLFELDPSKIEHKSGNLLWDSSDHPASPLATSGWINNDIGGAFRIGAKIDSEGRVFDLQLPHPTNIASLPPRVATQRRR